MNELYTLRFFDRIAGTFMPSLVKPLDEQLAIYLYFGPNAKNSLRTQTPYMGNSLDGGESLRRNRNPADDMMDALEVSQMRDLEQRMVTDRSERKYLARTNECRGQQVVAPSIRSRGDTQFMLGRRLEDSAVVLSTSPCYSSCGSCDSADVVPCRLACTGLQHNVASQQDWDGGAATTLPTRLVNVRHSMRTTADAASWATSVGPPSQNGPSPTTAAYDSPPCSDHYLSRCNSKFSCEHRPGPNDEPIRNPLASRSSLVLEC